MSGIAGMMHRDGRPVSPDAVATMSGAIAHRGRDASGLYCSGSVGIAHRMLWSTPESLRERQPLVAESGTVLLVADARIDNRAELVSDLALGAGSSVCDVDLIAAAYARWGTACVGHLIGDFAFALWDGRAQQMFCARDPMGVKPFYFFESERLFAFASEAKALLVLPEVPNDIAQDQVALFVDGTMDDRHSTMYSAIRRLPAAHTMTVTGVSVRQECYWRPDAVREVRFSTSRQYAEAFREIFGESVRARLRSAHAVGATLSGGLDSSSIVCMAREVQRVTAATPLHTFSLIFPSLPEKDRRLIDERAFIDAVVKGGGTSPTWVRGDELSPADDIDRILDALDEPYAAPNLYLHCGMYRAARERGVRVFLDGFDGDSAVSHGFARLNSLVRRNEWDVFEREVRAVANHRGMRPEVAVGYFGLPYLAMLARHHRWAAWARVARELTGRFGISPFNTLVDNGVRPAVPGPIRDLYRKIRGRAESAPLGRSAHSGTAQARASARLRDEDLDLTCSERESHVLGISQSAYQLTLEMADKCAAAVGIEPRYPFFDRRLIDFCVALPESEKLAEGWPRLVFRRAMQGILPSEIQWRSDKGNLSPNFHRGWRASRPAAVDTSADSVLAPFVELPALREMQQQYRDEENTLGKSAEGHTIFRVHVLERWLTRRASAGATSPPVLALEQDAGSARVAAGDVSTVTATAQGQGREVGESTERYDAHRLNVVVGGGRLEPAK